MDGDAVSGPSGIENADAECLELPAFRSRNSIPSRFPESSVRESNPRTPPANLPPLRPNPVSGNPVTTPIQNQ